MGMIQRRRPLVALTTTWLRLSVDLRWLFVSFLLWSIGFNLYLPLWPLYAADLGADAGQLGTLFSVSYLVVTVGYIPGGFIADRFDRKKVLIAMWVLATPSALIYALAETWTMLLPGAALYFLSIASLPAVNAYIADAAAPDAESVSFTTVYATWSMGTLLGPAAGGVIADAFGMRSVFFVAFAFYVLSTVALFPMSSRRARDTRSSASSYIQLLVNRRLAAWSAIFAVGFLILFLPVAFVSPFLETEHGLSVTWIGILASVAALGEVVMAPLLGRMADTGRRLAILGIAFLAYGIAFLLVAEARVVVALLFAFLMRGTFQTSQSLMTSTIGTFIPPHSRGRGFGLFGLMTGLAMTLAPLVGGWIYGRQPRSLFWTVALASFGIGAALIAKRDVPRLAPAPVVGEEAPRAAAPTG